MTTKRNTPWTHGDYLYRNHVVEVREHHGWSARLRVFDQSGTEAIVIQTTRHYDDKIKAERDLIDTLETLFHTGPNGERV